MATCVHTGAVIRLAEYGCILHGDIHAVEGESGATACYTITYNGEPEYDPPGGTIADWLIEIGSGIWNQRSKFIVVPPYCVLSRNR